jgi:hypothetical protein
MHVADDILYYNPERFRGYRGWQAKRLPYNGRKFPNVRCAGQIRIQYGGKLFRPAQN